MAGIDTRQSAVTPLGPHWTDKEKEIDKLAKAPSDLLSSDILWEDFYSGSSTYLRFACFFLHTFWPITIWPLAQCFLVLNVCSFYFVEKMACWSANVRIVEFFSSALEVLKIPSNSGFHKDFKRINKSSVGIKLREIFMISWFFSFISIRLKIKTI